MKSEHYKRIEEFMKLAGQDTPSSPSIPSEAVRKLRAKLILEEALETIQALGFRVVIDNDTEYNTEVVISKNMDFYPDFKPNLEEIIDGCADISVVTYGTLIACGVPDVPFIEEVDNNNLAKFGPGHTIREDGKLEKPPNHQPPKIKEILENL